MERRKQAKIAVLAQGFKLEAFNFYDDDTLRRFAPRKGEAPAVGLESEVSLFRMSSDRK